MSLQEINQLWETYYSRVFAYFYKRLNLKEDVEDLTSLTMFAFMDAMREKSDRIEKPDVYLWRIAHNQLAMFLKQKYKTPITVSYSEDWEFVDESLEDYESKTYQNRIRALMHCIENALKSQDLEIVKLSLIENIKSPEIATKLRLTPENVRQKLSRSLKTVRSKCLEVWNHYQA
jgi:RNA polymerase sigma factor (sigma-70 family)